MSNSVWTAKDIPDLSGKVIIVTGANSGIGLESAREFVRNGAEVILACRSTDKAEAALANIKQGIPNAKGIIMPLDLASLDSVHKFAAEFKAGYSRLDVLLNNAGIMMVPYGTTEDGFERQFGTNHLGHFALTGLLLDLLAQTPGSRVVNVSSGGHRMGNMDFDNLMYEGGQGYSPANSYARSKLANLLFTYELQRRLEAAEIRIASLASHPGGSTTNLGNHRDGWFFRAFTWLMSPLMQGAEMGALPSLRAAVDPQAKGGQYYGPDGWFMEMSGDPVVVDSNSASHNLDDAQRLWEISEQLTGVEYNWKVETQGA